MQNQNSLRFEFNTVPVQWCVTVIFNVSTYKLNISAILPVIIFVDSLPYTWITGIANFCVPVFNLICLNLYIPTKYIFGDQQNYWRILKVDVTLWFWILLVILKMLKLSLGDRSSAGQLHLSNYQLLVIILLIFSLCLIFFLIIYLWILFQFRCQYCFGYREGELEQSLFELFLLLAHMNY